jgi:hypothetical protein
MPYIIIIPILLLSAYYWYAKNYRIDALRKKRTPKAKPNPIREKSVQPDFRCVFIKHNAKACYSAQQLKTLPILMHEATALPLKDCDAEKCNCWYERFDDRRIGMRRNDIHSTQQFMITQKSRRQNLDRRKKEITSTNIEHRLGQQTISLF